MITPTGAAIAAAVRNREVPAEFTIEKIGIGSGEKDFPHANILRAMILREKEDCQVTVLETNVDDCTGEQLGYLQELLLEQGALDVVYRPILMKKSRPAYQIQVICKAEQVQQIEQTIFEETTTIGIRSYLAQRTMLERRMETIETPYGNVRVKIAVSEEKEYCYPEYEDLKQYCRKTKVPFRKAYEQIQNMAEYAKTRQK